MGRQADQGDLIVIFHEWVSSSRGRCGTGRSNGDGRPGAGGGESGGGLLPARRRGPRWSRCFTA
jgi:hypothetical protein